MGTHQLNEFFSEDILKRPHKFETIFLFFLTLLSNVKLKIAIVLNFVAFTKYLTLKNTFCRTAADKPCGQKKDITGNGLPLFFIFLNHLIVINQNSFLH